jgi:hypothetical protein
VVDDRFPLPLRRLLCCQVYGQAKLSL